jgi:hypothetical protein
MVRGASVYEISSIQLAPKQYAIHNLLTESQHLYLVTVARIVSTVLNSLPDAPATDLVVFFTPLVLHIFPLKDRPSKCLAKTG